MRGVEITADPHLLGPGRSAWRSGLLLGLMRSSRLAVLRVPAAVYIEIFRATPILVQIVWIYYALPIVLGVQMGNMAPPCVGIGLHGRPISPRSSAAASISIDNGQWDAAERSA